MARHCHYCGAFTGHNPIHPCPKFRTEPDLPVTPPIRVNPPRSDQELEEAFRQWQRSIEK